MEMSNSFGSGLTLRGHVPLISDKSDNYRVTSKDSHKCFTLITYRVK